MTAVIGHRGASFDFPENTLEAFAGARAQGADWIELDVRLSRDGELVVHHDPVLADGRIIAETDRVDIAGSVPSLRSALAACSPMGVNVEIKNSPHEPGFDESQHVVPLTLDAIAAMATPIEILISSFEIPTLDAVRSIDASMATGVLMWSANDAGDAVELAVAGGHTAINPYHEFVTPELLERCHDAALRIYTWTIDDPDRIAEFGRWGVDGVITNRPAVARQALLHS